MTALCGQNMEYFCDKSGGGQCNQEARKVKSYVIWDIEMGQGLCQSESVICNVSKMHAHSRILG
jgi:hypothetical protein